MSSKSGELIITSQETRAGEGPLAYITAIVRFEKYSDYLEMMGHIDRLRVTWED